MISSSIKIELSTMPTQPGVYQFLNKESKIIYIGKAKNLKKRVSSYFRGTISSRKTKNLVKNIAEIKHVVVNSESDALLLENTLIKKFQPKYNILLRDDKTYPWIVIKNEAFPRVLTTRRVEKDGSEYFGPFTNYKTVKTNETRIYQENFNLDKLDGNGPSGYNMNINKMQMIFIDYSWYGAGKIRFGIRVEDGDIIYFHELKQNNINTEAYMRSGNIPGRFEISTKSKLCKLQSEIPSNLSEPNANL